MKKIFTAFAALCICFNVFSQTKKQTLEFINSTMRNYNNGRDVGRIYEKSPTVLVYQYNLMNYNITNEFNPKNGINCVHLNDGNGEKFTINFKADAVKRKAETGEDTDDAVRMVPLTGITKEELIRFNKALIYLFKLYGGNLQESAF